MQRRHVLGLMAASAFPLAGSAGYPLRALAQATPETEEGEGEEEAPVHVHVELGDFFVKPSQLTYVAGQPYEFIITNNGKATHEFIVEKQGAADEPLTAKDADDQEIVSEVEDIEAGKKGTLRWTFEEPGMYTMACHVPGHLEGGMHVDFEVVETIQTLMVELGDFFVHTDGVPLKADVPTLFHVTNGGKAVHELVLESAATTDEPFEADGLVSEIEDIEPEQIRELVWTLPAGDYQLACHIPGHFEAGMKVEFKIG